MTWHRKEYQRIYDRYTYSARVGFVQKIQGSARYRGSEPSYVKHLCRLSGNPVYGPDYYDSLAGNKPTDAMLARAYAKVVSQVSNPAALGVSMAEYKSSFDMISRRAVSIARAYKALRRFDLPRVAKELSLPRDVTRDVQRRVSKKHLVTQNWLEYWMGWAPLVSDIAQCVDVVTRETVETKRFKVAVTESDNFVIGGDLPNPWPPRHSIKNTKTFGYYATVRVSNPNAYMANQLGLTNPAAIAWELVPFSFMANWFVNVDQVLSSYSDFVGLEVQDSGRFFTSRVSGSELAYTWDPTGSYLTHRSASWNSVFFQRVAAPIERPPLVFTMPNRLSLTRAATSISLLTQLFVKP